MTTAQKKREIAGDTYNLCGTYTVLCVILSAAIGVLCGYVMFYEPAPSNPTTE